jgi:ActR/RegA family two-component response regulator
LPDHHAGDATRSASAEAPASAETISAAAPDGVEDTDATIELIAPDEPATAAPPAVAASAAPASPPRSAAASEAKAKAQPSPAPSANGRVAIIDVEGSWHGIQLDRGRIGIIAPEAASSLADGLPQDPILVNLAAPGALAAAVALRDAGVTSRFVTYIGAVGTGKALRLGTTEVLGGPMDPDAVLAALTCHVTRGTRVLAAGADADAVMSLRQALSRQGASVSMAWDSNQARDLLAMTKPAVAVIDLELPPRDGCALVAALADLNPVPTAVLISQTMDGAARFAAEAADRSRAVRLISLQQLVTDLLRAG